MRCLPVKTERNAIRDAARRLNVRFAGLFLVADLATRLSRVGRREKDASDATPEIAGLQENYNIGAIDWAVIDASGTPEQTLETMQEPDRAWRSGLDMPAETAMSLSRKSAVKADRPLASRRRRRASDPAAESDDGRAIPHFG